MSKKITKTTVINAMKTAVSIKGEDYVYSWNGQPYDKVDSCFYAEPDGSPSCIVGYVLADLKPKQFERVVKVEEGTGVSLTVLNLANQDYLRGFTPAAVEALRQAQHAQDAGYTWGAALADAIKSSKDTEADK